MHFTIEKGTKITVGKRQGVIDQCFHNTGKLNIKMEDGSDFTITHNRLMKLYNKGEVVFGEPPTYVDANTQKSKIIYINKKLTDAEREEITRKENYALACIRNKWLLSQSDCEVIIREVALKLGDEKCPSTKAVRGWAHRYLATDDPRALLDHHACKGNRKPKLPEAARTLIATFVKANYLRRNGEHMQQVCDRINHEIRRDPEKYGVKSISYTSIRNYVSSLPAMLVVRKRSGYKKAKNEFPTGLHRDEAQYLLEWVEIDQTQLNIYVIDEKGNAIGRPWLTIVLDRKSRMVLWFHLSMKRLDGNMLPRILYMAMRPKDMDALRQQYPGLTGEWPAQGVFQEAVLDNGMENHTHDFQTACTDIIRTQLHYVIPGKGSDKAYVERLFRYIKESFVTLYPGSYANDDAGKAAEKAAELSFEEFERLFAIWLIDVYHNKPHSEPNINIEAYRNEANSDFNMTPLKKWKECIALHGSTRLPACARDFEQLLWRSKKGILQKWGLQFAKLRFKSTELLKIGGRHGFGKKRLAFYYNPYDLSSIQVIHPDTNEILDVPCSYAEYRNGAVTYEEHLEIRAAINANKKWCAMNPEAAYAAAFELLYRESNEAHKRSNAKMRKARAKKKPSSTEKAMNGAKPQPAKKSTAADYMKKSR